MRSRASVSVFVVWWLAVTVCACVAMTRFTAYRLDATRAQDIADAVVLVAATSGMQQASDIASHLSSSLIRSDTLTEPSSAVTVTVRTPWGDATSAATGDAVAD